MSKIQSYVHTVLANHTQLKYFIQNKHQSSIVIHVTIIMVSGVADLLIDVWDVCFCVLHLDEPFLSVLTLHSQLVSECTSGSHVQSILCVCVCVCVCLYRSSCIHRWSACACEGKTNHSCTRYTPFTLDNHISACDSTRGGGGGGSNISFV